MSRNRAKAEMGSAQIFLLCLSFFFSLSCAEISTRVGINYGLLGNNLPSPSKSVKLIQLLKANRVKLYEPNPEILKALSGKKLQASVMVPNQLITSISSNQTLSDQWVETNIVPYYPKTLIRYLLVGNEILSFYSDQDKVTWHNLVPAMRRIRASLKSHHIRKVKVGTPLAMDVLESSFPPSNGTFRSDVAESVVRPLLQFINRTKSFFFLDVYPYFVWSQNYQTVNLDYALFKSTNVTYTDPKSGLVYRNMLDQMLDAVFFAVDRLGFPETRLWICETGWPNAGDIDQIGANIYNAATYNRNLVKRLTTKPAIGTPARPGLALPAFIFALYNENLKGGPGTERHWGLFYPNRSNVYPIDLSGGVSDYSGYPPLPKPENNEPYRGKIWCVVAKGANLTDLGSALGYACGQGNGTCDPIQPGKECNKPDSLVWHASYAFSSYWAQFRSSGGTCYFNGLAVQTTRDPSYGHCKFPSVTL
ncbi:X8 domain [Dillenia turbinata]|uniref:glucan endo-1,3-beta-D-glucosidase n=1 Tax=Dillenia turbinata TaxID=194707 RepID=A0AAN8W5V9_9MAGN